MPRRSKFTNARISFPLPGEDGPVYRTEDRDKGDVVFVKSFWLEESQRHILVVRFLDDDQINITQALKLCFNNTEEKDTRLTNYNAIKALAGGKPCRQTRVGRSHFQGTYTPCASFERYVENFRIQSRTGILRRLQPLIDASINDSTMKRYCNEEFVAWANVLCPRERDTVSPPPDQSIMDMEAPSVVVKITPRGQSYPESHSFFNPKQAPDLDRLGDGGLSVSGSYSSYQSTRITAKSTNTHNPNVHEAVSLDSGSDDTILVEPLQTTSSKSGQDQMPRKRQKLTMVDPPPSFSPANTISTANSGARTIITDNSNSQSPPVTSAARMSSNNSVILVTGRNDANLLAQDPLHSESLPHRTGQNNSTTQTNPPRVMANDAWRAESDHNVLEALAKASTELVTAEKLVDTLEKGRHQLDEKKQALEEQLARIAGTIADKDSQIARAKFVAKAQKVVLNACLIKYQSRSSSTGHDQ